MLVLALLYCWFALVFALVYLIDAIGFMLLLVGLSWLFVIIVCLAFLICRFDLVCFSCLTCLGFVGLLVDYVGLLDFVVWLVLLLFDFVVGFVVACWLAHLV